ncbi:MAG TPA: aldolase/citrate lyase family protein [Burkholderiales bacterium]|nr:aldolase/citrate lyase family protein [Burkholderiales bacterium]
MRANKLRQLWAQGKVASCLWIDLGWTVSVEALARLPYDAFVLDLQHSLIDRATGVHVLQTLSLGDGVPLVRVTQNDPAEIGFVLDAGAYGVICPQIETAEDCKRFVAACRYAPEGRRSWGPTRGLLYGGADYFKSYRENILTVALIETVKGVRNMREIAATPGLDMLYVGPNDLTIDHGGQPTYVATDPRVIEAMESSIAIAREHSIVAGTYAGTMEVARAAIAKGYSLVSVGYAAKLMVKAAAELLAQTFPHTPAR